jgi:hypothetical protein
MGREIESRQGIPRAVGSFKKRTTDNISSQTDQIVRLFAYWVIVYIGQFFFKLQKLPKMLGYFFPRQKLCTDLDQH